MKTVFVMGSLNYDLVMDYDVFPRPGETVKGKAFFANPGGKGANQAVASAKQGAKTIMLGAVGSDHYGTELIKSISDYGVDGSHVRIKPGTSGVAIILLHDKENRILINGGANDLYSIADAYEDLKILAKPGDILVLQFETPVSVLNNVIPLASSIGIQIILNPAPAIADFPKMLYRYINVLIPNELEAATLAGLSQASPDSHPEALALCGYGAKNIIITLGERGSLHYDGTSFQEIPAVKVQAIDTTAAGDTFIGTIAAELSIGHPLAEAIVYASESAAITVTRKGAQQSIPTRDEVRRYMKDRK